MVADDFVVVVVVVGADVAVVVTVDVAVVAGADVVLGVGCCRSGSCCFCCRC